VRGMSLGLQGELGRRRLKEVRKKAAAAARHWALKIEKNASYPPLAFVRWAKAETQYVVEVINGFMRVFPLITSFLGSVLYLISAMWVRKI